MNIRQYIFRNIHEELDSYIQRMHIHHIRANQATSVFKRKYHRLMVFHYHKKIFIRFACDITPSAQLNNVVFRHPVGIVIGGGAQLDDGVIIHQGVTLGAVRFDENNGWRGVDCEQFIGKRTILCTGAKILGNVKIGKNCIVGANAVVTIDVPDNHVVVGYNRILPR